MISLILADAEIERVPRSCLEGADPPRICHVKDAELRGIIVLDSYIHKHVLEGLEQAERRGRPDIVHSFLLLAQGSRACAEGKLRSYVHTRGDEVVLVGSEYRPEQSYIDFLRSFGELLEKGAIGETKTGLRLEREMDLRALVGRLNAKKVIVLSPSGEERELRELFQGSGHDHLVVIIGGFPEGDYRSPVYEIADEKVSLGEELLTVPDVTSQVLSSIP
jgi:rRNA small subunit pseudouridine methyltransferase Nep1